MQPTNENLLIVKLAVRENIWTQAYEIHKKDFEYTKDPREKISNPRNTYDGNAFVPTKYRRRHNGTRPMRLTVAHDVRNLAHPIKRYFEKFCQLLCRNLFLINL